MKDFAKTVKVRHCYLFYFLVISTSVRSELQHSAAQSQTPHKRCCSWPLVCVKGVWASWVQSICRLLPSELSLAAVRLTLWPLLTRALGEGSEASQACHILPNEAITPTRQCPHNHCCSSPLFVIAGGLRVEKNTPNHNNEAVVSSFMPFMFWPCSAECKATGNHTSGNTLNLRFDLLFTYKQVFNSLQ